MSVTNDIVVKVFCIFCKPLNISGGTIPLYLNVEAHGHTFWDFFLTIQKMALDRTKTIFFTATGSFSLAGSVKGGGPTPLRVASPVAG